jgi:hypothetical protein
MAQAEGSDPGIESRREDLRHEYTETAASYRHFSNLRFAILTVYVALVGALGSVALSIVGAADPWVSWVASVGAVVVTATFFACERVCEGNRRYFVSALVTIEHQLDYTTMTNFPHNRVLRAAPMLFVFYSANLVFWSCVAIAGCMRYFAEVCR